LKCLDAVMLSLGLGLELCGLVNNAARLSGSQVIG